MKPPAPSYAGGPGLAAMAKLWYISCGASPKPSRDPERWGAPGKPSAPLFFPRSGPAWAQAFQPKPKHHQRCDFFLRPPSPPTSLFPTAHLPHLQQVPPPLADPEQEVRVPPEGKFSSRLDLAAPTGLHPSPPAPPPPRPPPSGWAV